jgi:hypothetical protein
LTNKTKYRGIGIDIRSNGGFIVTAPSKLYDKEYKYIRTFNDTELLEIPETLIHWLLLNNKETKITTKQQNKKRNTKIITNDTNYNYNINDNMINKIINSLPDKYLDDYNNWLIVTTVLKNLNKFNIWDEWSKKSNKYNYNKNITLWNSNNGVIDINYLIYVINTENKTNYKFIEKYKKYNTIINDIKCDKITMNNKYLSQQFSYDTFKKYDTIIIKSCTGTGKTTTVANHFSNYFLQNKNYKMLSIITRRSLTNQHIKTFKDFNIELISYENKNIKNFIKIILFVVSILY